MLGLSAVCLWSFIARIKLRYMLMVDVCKITAGVSIRFHDFHQHQNLDYTRHDFHTINHRTAYPCATTPYTLHRPISHLLFPTPIQRPSSLIHLDSFAQLVDGHGYFTLLVCCSGYRSKLRSILYGRAVAFLVIFAVAVWQPE